MPASQIFKVTLLERHPSPARRQTWANANVGQAGYQAAYIGRRETLSCPEQSEKGFNGKDSGPSTVPKSTIDLSEDPLSTNFGISFDPPHTVAYISQRAPESSIQVSSSRHAQSQQSQSQTQPPSPLPRPKQRARTIEPQTRAALKPRRRPRSRWPRSRLSR
ncbi:hypothetical protein F5883DRAFT_182318 [Diaporthe sp. PMI_573]|nr:hypothetical protein F5883DRAFT_182318 [Diaporthaceae sp. PMI_573]